MEGLSLETFLTPRQRWNNQEMIHQFIYIKNTYTIPRCFLLDILNIVVNLYNTIVQMQVAWFVSYHTVKFLDIHATIECRFTLKHVRDMIKYTINSQ